MKKLATSVAALTVSAGLSFAAFAGGPDVVAQPAPSFVPGFYVGLGGGFYSVETRGTAQLNVNNNPVTFSALTDNTQMSLAPVVQLGYMGVAPFGDGSWMWGLKALYSYIGADYNDNFIGNVGDLSAFDFGVANDHFVQLLLQLGHQFSNNLIGYVGGGVSYLHSRFKFNNLNATFNSTSQNYWGGTAAIGMLLALPHGFFLDGQYSFTYLPGKVRTQTYLVNNNDTFNGRVSARPIVNQLVLSINKSFNS